MPGLNNNHKGMDQTNSHNGMDQLSNVNTNMMTGTNANPNESFHQNYDMRGRNMQGPPRVGDCHQEDDYVPYPMMQGYNTGPSHVGFNSCNNDGNSSDRSVVHDRQMHINPQGDVPSYYPPDSKEHVHHQSWYPPKMNNYSQNPHVDYTDTSNMSLLTPKTEPTSGMSLWTKTQQLPTELLKIVQGCYSTDFPIEIRHYFAEWIERQPWNQIDENDQKYDTFSQQILDSLLEQVQVKADELPLAQEYFLLKLKLQQSANHLRTVYQNSPRELVRMIKRCLNTEEQLIQQHENPAAGQNTIQNDTNSIIMKQVEKLQIDTQATEQDVSELQNKQELFIVNYQTQHKVNMQLQQTLHQPNSSEKEEKQKQLSKQKKEIEQDLTKKAEELLRMRVALASKHCEIFQGLEDLQKQVVDGELISWKRKQQFSGNGAPFDKHMLDTLQKWVEALAEMIWKSRQQILQVQVLRQNLPINFPENVKDLLPELDQKITGLLSSLVTSTFIVESQPPQVLKKESKFSARVRLLVGGKLNIHMSPPQVKASIISENQARNLLKSDSKTKQENSGEILNNQRIMEYNKQRGELSIEFRNMQLKRIKRADRRGTESVTEEKFCILFQSDFQIGNGALMFQVWTLSLPVVVTVHGNQECNAMATILWDNQFNEPGRVPFMVPDQVPWPAMAELLCTKFSSSTDRGLDHNNLQYLATKLFGGSTKDDFSSKMVTWAMFNRDPLQAPSRNFSFWEWFYQVRKLVKEHLKPHWADGMVMGFISKQDSQDLLRSTSPGTFLLRFSDNFLGGVTVAWVSENPTTLEKQVWNLHPFSARDFGIRSLADRIKDLPSLVYLYPNIPKDQAFGKFYSKPTDSNNQGVEGYIKHQLMAMIPNGIPGVPAIDNPDTPGPYTCPESPASTVYSQGPTSPAQDVTSTNMGGQVERMDSNNDLDMDIAMLTDYNADDMLNDINVNELLYTRDGLNSTFNS